MSIYAIADLHLSFNTDKPMDIFGPNWENHAEKIKQDWLEKVKNEVLHFQCLLCSKNRKFKKS